MRFRGVCTCVQVEWIGRELGVACRGGVAKRQGFTQVRIVRTNTFKVAMETRR